MKRGEVWWPARTSAASVVLARATQAHEVRALVIAAPVSTTVRGFSLEIRVGKAEGLPKSAVVNGDWLVTVPKADLIERAGVLSREKLARLDQALRFALGLDDGAA